MNNGFNQQSNGPKAEKVGSITERVIQKRDGSTFTKLTLKLGNQYFILRENTYPSKYPDSRVLFNVYVDDFVPTQRQPQPQHTMTPEQDFSGYHPAQDIPMGQMPQGYGQAPAATAPMAPAQPVQAGFPAYGNNGFGQRR